MEIRFDHDTFLSPFTWRYGSDTMRHIWSEHHKRITLRSIWVALAKAQQSVGLVTAKQVADLEAHQNDVDIARATEIENEIHHDLMAEIKTYAEQCPTGGSIIHLGATSMDILDNMDVLRQQQALDLIIDLVEELLGHFGERIAQTVDVPCMAFTHIQPAEPTTIGYRLAQTAQDLLDDLEELQRVRKHLKGKGLKGAVGTSASYKVLLSGSSFEPADLERMVMEELHLEAFDAATQVYPRKQDWRLGTVLAGTCATIAKFALDFRILQSPPIGEWSEPFGSKQVGSSAMPFKRNPINSEKIDSLCRLAAAQVDVLWHNAADTILERTLDDSANRRITIPQLFLATEEVLATADKLIRGAVFHTDGIRQTLAKYGLFAASERLLMELGRRGADRQKMHEIIREHSLKAWAIVQRGEGNPLAETLSSDEQIIAHISKEEVLSLLDASDYVGDAPERARLMVERISCTLSKK
jgi:adenylosuccinate lyase